MYQKVSTDLNFVAREHEVERFWKENDIFRKSEENRKGCPVYSFYDGPPTANGKPHIGHVLTRAIKDMIPRYHTMKGQKSIRKAGWDTHGLPVEIEVEKQLGLNGKEQIEQYGLEPFIQKCKESVWRYKGMWEDFSSTVGFWADMDDPYVTYDNNYIESVWWSLKEIRNKGLLYKGYKTVPYCPRCGTPLSSHEVAQGYKVVKERSAIAKFKIKGREGEYFLAWTTTPWTLPSNVGLCVNPDFDYVKVSCAGEVYILAEGLTSVLRDPFEVLERYRGSDLNGMEYEPLYPIARKLPGRPWHVVCDSYVTLSDGTGIVHIAPAFGEDDSRVGRENDLPFLQLVDGRGNMTDETLWPGTWVKDADPLILKDLDARGLLYAAPKFEHNYPHCWRCGTPLLYYARESWFIKMTAVRDDLIANNKTINWIPKSIGERRFGDWLENVQDWGISRNRYWGTPLNIWQCSCGHCHSVGSIAELRELSKNCPEDIELHRPFLDEVTITCPECGGEMHRVPEVIDCWYDSGSMPFAQWHYPFENRELFEENFPADFISEAVDQTRGWFYSLLAISTLVFNKAPYKNVIVLGLVLDEDGQKMSKSKGNAVEPADALARHGADAVRWYFYSNSAPWLPSRFSDAAVTEGARKFMGTLWNTYAFWVLYANIDGFNAAGHSLEKDKLSTMDRWLLSRLNSTVKVVDRELSNYAIPEAARALQTFVDEMSNWYVRRSRGRFWGSDMGEDKISAYMTLYTALVTFSKLAAPMIPFMTEEIYRNLVCSVDSSAPISVHLCDYPVADESLIDLQLEKDMETVLELVALARAARNDAGVKNRQPLASLYYSCQQPLGSYYTDIIKDELNVKQVEFKADLSAYSSWSFKPQLKTVGPKFGKLVGEIRSALASLDGAAAKAELDSAGKLTLSLSGGPVELLAEDLLVEQARVEGFAAASAGGLSVALDVRLTKELEEEGFVREVISKLQTMRKDADFNVTDHVLITAGGSPKVMDIMDRWREAVMKDTLADGIEFREPEGYVKDWKINGEDCRFGVKVVG